MDFPLDDAIRSKINSYLCKIEEITDSDALFVNSDIADILPGIINKLLSDLSCDNKERDKLFFILTTYGGSVEAVERIVNVTRHFYKDVVFAVPDYAYSAGTVLCMSGDEIYMNYYSVLGPIDPQVANKDNKFIPAQGYLDKVEEFVEKSKNGVLTEAEYLMLRELDLADLRRYQQARELSIELLKKWLVQYKFKNWNIRRSSGKTVTTEQKEQRAHEIAGQLSDNNIWKSHGRGIDIHTLRALKLVIEDFDKNADLAKSLLDYYEMTKDYMRQKTLPIFVHTRRFML